MTNGVGAWAHSHGRFSNRDLPEALVEYAKTLGPLCIRRRRVGPGDVLVPTPRETAKRGSLSSIHGSGPFPLHNDTANWPAPCRYICFACVSPGDANRATLILPWQELPINDEAIRVLQDAVFLYK